MGVVEARNSRFLRHWNCCRNAWNDEKLVHVASSSVGINLAVEYAKRRRRSPNSDSRITLAALVGLHHCFQIPVQVACLVQLSLRLNIYPCLLEMSTVSNFVISTFDAP